MTPRGKMRGTEMKGVKHHGIWVPREPVCKAGEASPEVGWRIRPSPLSLFKWLELGMCKGQRP